MTPSPHIISLEIFTILRQISASPLAWNCVVKMVICWQGWGGDYQKKTLLCMLRVPLQGPSILPLWKRWAPNWPLCGIRDVWGRMPPVGVDPGVFCRPLGNDHVWTLWQIPLHYGRKGFLSNLYDILTDLLHLLHKLCLLGVYNWWGARIRTALCLSLHWDWRVGNSTSVINTQFCR